jgi:hypothetical protein
LLALIGAHYILHISRIRVKMELQEVGGSCGDWMELAQDRDRLWALVSTFRKKKKKKMRGIS